VSRAFLIVNPTAGGGRTSRLWPSIRDRLRQLGLEFEARETSGPGSATELADTAVSAGWPLVVAVGGDGTVNEVVNGLIDRDGRPRGTFGAILTGRGRDASRNLGIALDPSTALHRLVHGEEVHADLGTAEWRGGSRYFVNCAGAGFDAVVARRAQSIGRSGTLPYVLGILAALGQHRPVPASIEVDGRSAWNGPMTAAVVANGPYFGGGMRIAPAAAPDDGRLDLVILGALGRAELLAWLPSVYRGSHLRNAKVTTVRGQTMTIDASPSVPVQVDGEPVASTPVRVSIRPGALRLRR